MSDDKDKKAPEESEERTVFMPSGTASGVEPVATPEPPASEPAAGAEEPRTVFEPTTPSEPSAPAEPAAEAPAPAEPAASEPAAEAKSEPSAAEAAMPTPTSFTPREAARPIKVGDVLNHIFEVKRFLARGGMGEVFEGCNVNTDEKVAIKVMLPALAADEKVVAMFRKEARTLTKLNHEALVSYRVLAQEPQLGALYIVTEFIEGVELGEMLGKVERTPEELAGLLRRLASGLGAAHKLGAIHRDMSPDNVLLPGGDVHLAKIIDFGIAKDLDASSATIVGDGFAGKLNYVAPEQLGDYGREVGPWTDVYSLALVILAVANGKNVNMSGSLVDAIDKRRKGPDTSSIPDSLKPVIEAMLRPDPKDRLRSMDEVIAMLEGRGAPPVASTPPPGDTSTPAPAPSGGSKALIAIGVVVTLLVAAGGAWYLMQGIEPVDVNQTNQVDDRPGDPINAARGAINSVLPSVSCTWLDIADIRPEGDRLAIALRGVAGDPEAAQRELNQALTQAGVANGQLNFGDVAPITPAGCAALDTYRQMRATRDLHLVATAPRFEMVMQPPGAIYANQEAATAVVNLNLGNPNLQFAILGIEPSGVITRLIANRTDFETRLAQSVNGRPIASQGNDRYTLNIDLNHDGWSGVILITGREPFDADVVAPPMGSRGPAWRDRFVAAATERGWQVEMVWFESVNREQDAAAPPDAPPPEGGPADEPPAEDDKPTE